MLHSFPADRLRWHWMYGLLATLLSSSAAVVAQEVSLSSPDGRNEIRIAVEAGQVVYAVRRDRHERFRRAAIRPVLAGQAVPATVSNAVERERGSIDETRRLPWGKTSQIHNRCETVTINVTLNDGGTWTLELRAYDDGVAFRYRIPELGDGSPRILAGEDTAFRASDDPRALFNTLDGFRTSHESLYERLPWSRMTAGRLIDCPLLLEWPDGGAAAITEARVRHFAGMYLERPQSDTSVLRTRLAPSLNDPGVAVMAPQELVSPWRVILFADTAGKLLESNLLLCLNDDPQGDFSWLKPGKTTFHWWNGEFEDDFRNPDLTTTFVNRHKRYIDFCAKHGILYHGLSGDGRAWYPQSSPDYGAPSDDADVRVARPELELPAIFAYAKERGVGIRLWVHWKPLSAHLEEAFTQYEAWGVTGLMVDFLDRDDQEMIEFTERLLESAARHQLNIQIHGSSKFSGEQRTFPNLVNREGVLNLEYLKWSERCTPDHNVNVAFTRALAGPVDYHLGGFRSVSRAAFKPIPLLPTVLGTRCHHMALYLVYENPLPMLADRPDHYEGQPGFDFLCKLPTTWDETRFVAGEAGEYIVLARRSGDAWYFGGITNWTPRTIEVPLKKVLGEQPYHLTLYQDGSLDEDQPNEVKVANERAVPRDTLTIQLAPGGGFIGVASP